MNSKLCWVKLLQLIIVDTDIRVESFAVVVLIVVAGLLPPATASGREAATQGYPLNTHGVLGGVREWAWNIMGGGGRKGLTGLYRRLVY